MLEVNEEIENKHILEQWSYKYVVKIFENDKFLVRSIRKRKRGLKLLLVKIKETLRSHSKITECFEQLYINIFGSLGKKDKLLKKFNILNRQSSLTSISNNHKVFAL